jgi:hypothetical protein
MKKGGPRAALLRVRLQRREAAADQGSLQPLVEPAGHWYW